MKRSTAIRWARNPWLAVALLAVLIARALTPVGYMPGPDGLILCPGYAPLTGAESNSDRHGAASGMAMSQSDMAEMDMSGMDMSTYTDHSRTAPRHTSTGECPFAALLTGPALIYILTLAPSIPFSHPDIRRHFTPVILQSTLVLNHRPRGPPRLV